jgi:hypothetical protein
MLNIQANSTVAIVKHSKRFMNHCENISRVIVRTTIAYLPAAEQA